MVYKLAMPALLFILPLQLISVFISAYLQFGTPGLAFLLHFDEEKALKTGQSMIESANESKLPLH